MIPEYTFWSFNTQSSGRISPSISFRICFSLAQTSTCGWIHHNNSSVTALARLALHGQPLFAVEWIRFEAFPQNQNQLFIHKCTLTTASGSIRLLLWGRPPMEINPNLNHGQVHEHCRRWTLHKNVLSRQIKSWEIQRERIGVKAAVKHGVYVMRVRVHQLYK